MRYKCKDLKLISCARAHRNVAKLVFQFTCLSVVLLTPDHALGIDLDDHNLARQVKALPVNYVCL